MQNFDWQKVEDVAFEFIINSVKAIKQQYPDEHIYGAIFHCFYGDGENIYPPALSIGTTQLLNNIVDKYEQHRSFANETRQKLINNLRWLGADLEDYMFDSDDALNELSEQVAVYSKQTSNYNSDNEDAEENFEKWESVYQQFLNCFPKACQKATKYLLEQNLVKKDFIAVCNDEAQELVALSLTKEQLAKYFPDLLET